MSISAEGSSCNAGRFGVIAAALSVATLLACGGAPPQDQQPREGAALVAGTSITRLGLLAVPPAGGPAELRAVDDPSRVRWSGTRELPPTRAVYPIGRSVVLHGRDGTVWTFEPSGERLAEIGTVPADARWIPAPEGGAFVWGTSALLVRESEARRVDTDGRVVWAAPVAGGGAALLVAGEDGMRIELRGADIDAPAVTRSVGSAGPVALADWGREILLAEGDDGRRLVGRPLPDLEPVERTRLDRAPVVLASSPSEHRLFAGGAERLVTIDRYGWRSLDRTAFPGTVRELRPAPTGDMVLAHDGTQAWAIPADQSEPVELQTEWRSDLPLGLPGDRVLVLRDGELRMRDLGDEPDRAIEAPAEAWWAVVRWTPRRAEPVVRPPAAQDKAEALAAAAPERPLSVGLTTIGRVAGRTVANPSRPAVSTGLPGPDPAAGPADPFRSIPGGFYAVASSSRQLETIRELRQSLERSGYATEVLSRRDEANELWYRLMVGPYRSRSEAEAAAADLRRERGISAWIHEAIGDFGPGGAR